MIGVSVRGLAFAITYPPLLVFVSAGTRKALPSSKDRAEPCLGENISFGANPESFAETDSNLAQLKKLAKDKVAGGVVSNPGTDEPNFEIFS